MGPGKPIEFPEQMAYPFTEVLLLAPFSLLRAWLAAALVAALSSGLWAWAVVGNRGYVRASVGGASLAAVFALAEGQWSLLLTAAALMPALGWLFAIKPTIGLALFAAYPSRRTVIGVAAFALLATLIYPKWPIDWYRTTRTVQHLVSIITRPGGFLVLFALLRWREPAARLLVALACVPHTTLPYETLYLFFVPQTWSRAWVLCGLSYLTPLLLPPTDPMTHEYVQRYADAILWTMYVPCVLMLLFRPHGSRNCVEAVSGLRARSAGQFPAD
jgi:hypothetical protein